MSKMRIAGFAVSVDGFGAGPDQSPEHPLGKRGGELMGWFFPPRSLREMHGQSGGEIGPDDELARRDAEAGLRGRGDRQGFRRAKSRVICSKRAQEDSVGALPNLEAE